MTCEPFIKKLEKQMKRELTLKEKKAVEHMLHHIELPGNKPEQEMVVA
jgi:hypothetical protein